MPHAAAFANKASPLFQADWADAEPLKFVLRDLGSSCERAPRRKRGHAPASLEKDAHLLHKMCRCGAQLPHVLCGVR